MKYNPSILFFLLIGILLLYSCNPNLIQKGYIINSPNVNCFQNEKEKNIKVTASVHQLELQSDIALTNKFGVASTLYTGGNSIPVSYGGELGGIFYQTPFKFLHYEVQAGYGYFDDRSDIDRSLNPFIESGRYMQYVNTRYDKIYLQPSIFFMAGWFKIGLTVKFNEVYFTNYYFHYENETILLQGPNAFESSDVQFKYKWCHVYEPVLTIKFGAFYIQIVAHPYYNNIYNSQIFYGYGSPGNMNLGFLSHPQISTFVFNIGFEFKIGKKQ